MKWRDINLGKAWKKSHIGFCLAPSQWSMALSNVARQNGRMSQKALSAMALHSCAPNFGQCRDAIPNVTMPLCFFIKYFWHLGHYNWDSSQFLPVFSLFFVVFLFCFSPVTCILIIRHVSWDAKLLSGSLGLWQSPFNSCVWWLCL